MARRFLTTAELTKIKFNQSSDAGLQQGEMIYDSEHLALMFGLSANVKMELGQSTVILVYNDTLSTIPAGRAVYGVGVQNERPSVVQSTSATSEQSSRTFGITAESIPAGGSGWVVTQGLLIGVNTSSFLSGDELWLSPTSPGVLVTTPAGSPNHDLLTGYCIVSSATDGVIYVSFARGVDISGIHDIVLSGLASGDILRYNSASGYWENEPLSSLGGGATVSETAPTSPSAGDLWFNSATAETFIYYDSTWVEVGEGGGDGGVLEPVQGLEFDTVAPDVAATARLVWDDGEGTLAFGLKDGLTNLQIGQENVALCYNGTGSSISKGSVVYINGAQGQRPSITLAQANSEATSSKVLGITTQAISNGSEGFVATFGIVNSLDTSAYTAGQALWLSPTVAGGLTATKPVAPNHMVFVGYAISINASSGRIFVNPQNGYELDEIHDVLIGTKTDRDVLMYESSTGLWKNEQINLGTDTVGNYVASVSGTDGVSISGTGEGAAVTIANSDKGSSQNIFKNIAVSGQTTVVADSNDDTLTLANGTGITITTNATTDTITVTNAGVTSFSAGTTGLTPSTGTTGAVTLAGTLTAVNGGTGQSSYAVGDILQASTTTALSKLPAVATGNVLISGGANTVSSWGKVGLTTHVSGTLPVGNGGTGLATTPTNGQLLIGNGTNYTLATLTQGTGITVTNGSGTISIANAGVTGLTGTANEVEVSASTGSVTIGLPNDVTIGNNLTVTGTLTVNGTTTTVNSTTLSVDDPIITLGGDTAPVADDNKDRGIEFRYFDTQARLGFMGYDDSAGTFVFLTAATNTSEVFSGTKGTIDANISGSNINAGTVSATYIDSAIARLASPTFTGTVTLPLTTAGYVTTTSGGVIGSVATIPNAGLTNSSITIGSTSVSLGGTAATVAGLTLTDPTIANIAAATTTAADLWSEVTTGSIAIGAGLTTGALNIATVGTGATPISIGHTNSTIGITGNTTITGTLTITGNLDTNLTTAGVVTTNASGVLSSTALLPLSQGGTNANLTAANGGVVYSTASAMAITAAGTSGQALVSAGASAPVWTTLTLENLPGAFVKRSVRAATTGSNIGLSGTAPSTLDGVTLAANDRILVKDQTAPAQNGIYIVQTLGTGANGTWVRAADADTIAEIASAMVAVDEGTTNGGLTFDNDSKTTDTLGTTAVTWNRVVDTGYSMNIGTTAVQIGRASGALTLAGITLSAPTFTGTITTSLTTAGYVTTTAGGVLGSVATIPNAGLTNSSITIGSTSVSLGGTAATVAGLTLTSPVIDTVAASAAAATPVLWSTVTTGSIGIGQGLTTGALNIATVGTGATPISIGHTNATIGITGNTTITGTLTITGSLDTALTTAGVVTTNASGVLSSSASLGVANGGTGLTATPTNGQLAIGNGSGYTLATITQGTGITVTNGAGTISIANAGVTTISFGTTGLTPSTATSGAVTVAGTLAVANGGTGVTSSTGTGSVVLSASPTFTGTPAAPTAAVDTNTTQIATTAYVVGQGYLKSSTAGTTYVPLEVLTKDDLTTRTQSGFYQTSTATIAEGWPETTNNWMHLISSTHSNTGNYYSLQIAGSFFDQGLYFRKTNNVGTQTWKKFATVETDINTQTVSYQLVLEDRDRIVEMNVASANNLTVPPNSTVAFPIGTSIDIIQYGAGQTTIVAGAGVTIRSNGGLLKLSGQYAGATLYKRGTDEWVVIGDLV